MTQEATMAKRAVIYLRARSVGDNSEGIDAQLARQRAVCTRIADQHGASVVQDYEAIGGVRDGHVRYIVSVMLRQAAEAKADYVITSGFDRLFRGPADTDRELMRAIRDSGVVLLYGSEWDVAAPGNPSDDVLAETYQAILMGRSA